MLKCWNVDLVFIAEPQIFQSDLPSMMTYFKGDYFSSLNSHDLYNHDLPLVRTRAIGGTMVMWKSNLDPFLTVHSVDSTAFLPVILNMPDAVPSVHIAVYLPTAGKDSIFLDDLAKLKVVIDELKVELPDAIFFIRGDANSSRSNSKR